MNTNELEISLQPIRVGAIRLQIESLTKQALVIEKISTEHHQGIDLGMDPELQNILSNTEKLSDQIDQIVAATERTEGDAVRQAGGRIMHLTSLLASLAASFKRGESHKARLHLAESLEPCAEAPVAVARPEDETSAIKASVNCFKAEINQYSTLELQVQALCNLALEVAFNAADEVSVTLSNEPSTKA